MSVNNYCAGKYRHYKNKKLYEIIDIALHSETYEEMVVYKALYDCEEFGLSQIWVRPKKMFFENVVRDGVEVARFEKISE